MPNYEIQITTFPASNLVEDAVTNSWSTDAVAVGGAILHKDTILVLMETMRPFFSNLVRQSNHTWKIYDRADPKPRAPLFMGLWAFTLAPTGNPLPTESALCLSFQGPLLSGVPQARRRGRVYLGPFNVTSLDLVGRPTVAIRNALRNAGEVMRVASAAAGTYKWAVFSSVTGTPTTVTNGWVDDEFDTQRRRGRKPTTRVVFP